MGNFYPGTETHVITDCKRDEKKERESSMRLQRGVISVVGSTGSDCYGGVPSSDQDTQTKGGEEQTGHSGRHLVTTVKSRSVTERKCMTV